MMTLEEAINHAREVAEKNRKCQEENTIILSNRWISSVCCAEEHEQLAEWLEEIDKQQKLEKQLSQPENTDEIIKVAAERDVYKDLYMKITEKLIGDKI